MTSTAGRRSRYQQVGQVLDTAIGGPEATIGWHGPFWRGLTRDELVAMEVFGLPLLEVGSGSSSNLVRALKGEAPFGADLPDPPPGSRLPRMPAGLPAIKASRIALIERWIDDGCPGTDGPRPRRPR